MELSTVKSSAKSSGSDFSIERILSDEPKSSRQTSEPPSWLFCTRYRPPKLPRICSGSSRRSGRHARVPFTAEQAAALEGAYSREPYLAPPALRALASALQLRDDRIKIWFQNRRARERREKCVTILPPHSTTLLPTNYQPINEPTNTWRGEGGPTVTSHTDYPSHTENKVNHENETSSHTYNDNSSDDESSTLVDIVTIDED